jgi:uncharacterized membrane protein YedE/YeeE
VACWAGPWLAAWLSGRFAWEGFESPAQMGRSLSGAALMGVGGVIAGGCTVGAGLSGVATLSVAAMIALGSIVAGMLIAGAVEARAGRGARGLVAAEGRDEHPNGSTFQFRPDRDAELAMCRAAIAGG